MSECHIGNYDQVGVEFDAAQQTILANLPNIDASPDDIINWSPDVAKMATNPPYDYPLLKNVRDINPVTLSIWHQTAQAASASNASDASVISYNPPYTYWISYDAADSTVLQKIPPGQALDFTLFRPQIKEQTANLYVFALDTDDQTKAQQFFDNLFKIEKPPSYYTQITNPLNVPDAFSILPDTRGIIADNDSGVTGMFILKDILRTTGIGSGPFYYTIPPAYLVLTQLANVVGSYLPENVDSSPAALKDTILSWISYFVKNKAAINALGITDATSEKLQQAVPELTNYLQTNGSDSTKKNLNGALYNLLYGPTSLTHLPIIWQAGGNSFTSQPSNWPQPASDQSSA